MICVRNCDARYCSSMRLTIAIMNIEGIGREDDYRVESKSTLGPPASRIIAV